MSLKMGLEQNVRLFNYRLQTSIIKCRELDKAKIAT